MSRNTWFFFTLIISPIIHLSQVASQCGGFAIKRDDKLVLYRITLNTYWTRIRFPKHYPDQRVPQFGKLIGRTHDRTYSLYRLGTRLNAGITQYIETGETRGLASEGNSPSVLDSFTGSAITRGEGTSTTRAFLDSNHTVVSAVARIIPSPDWFVGVDSFQLCIDGDWIDSVTVELDPLDAGTNEGLTFTSLMQRTWPQSLAYRITSRYPGHPAASFNYPNLPRLPPIATLTFTKVRKLLDPYPDPRFHLTFFSAIVIFPVEGVHIGQGLPRGRC
uniref:Spon2 protein n=1 Tax=Fopius arisanus TaxID=64838 RepID=A0A0C9QM49_9HYME